MLLEDPVLQGAQKPSADGDLRSIASAGVQGLTEALDELSDCELHIHSEYVQMHAGLVQILKTRKKELCRAIAQIAAKGAQRIKQKYPPFDIFTLMLTLG